MWAISILGKLRMHSTMKYLVVFLEGWNQKSDLTQSYLCRAYSICGANGFCSGGAPITRIRLLIMNLVMLCRAEAISAGVQGRFLPALSSAWCVVPKFMAHWPSGDRENTAGTWYWCAFTWGCQYGHILGWFSPVAAKWDVREESSSTLRGDYYVVRTMEMQAVCCVCSLADIKDAVFKHFPFSFHYPFPFNLLL